MNDDDAFLGRGWSFPPDFSAGGAVMTTVGGMDDIGQSLRIILETEPGERVMRPNFGSGVNRHLFEKIDGMLRSEIADTVRTALLRWEPRIAIEGVDILEQPERPGEVLIEIGFRVPATNSRYNMVLPFAIAESNRRPL